MNGFYPSVGVSAELTAARPEAKLPFPEKREGLGSASTEPLEGGRIPAPTEQNRTKQSMQAQERKSKHCSSLVLTEEQMKQERTSG